MGVYSMGTNGKGDARFAPSEWAKFIIVVFGHALMVFGALVYWANRIVVVETKVAAIEQNVTHGLSEVRKDIKEILVRTPKP